MNRARARARVQGRGKGRDRGSGMDGLEGESGGLNSLENGVNRSDDVGTSPLSDSRGLISEGHSDHTENGGMGASGGPSSESSFSFSGDDDGSLTEQEGGDGDRDSDFDAMGFVAGAGVGVSMLRERGGLVGTGHGIQVPSQGPAHSIPMPMSAPFSDRSIREGGGERSWSRGSMDGSGTGFLAEGLVSSAPTRGLFGWSEGRRQLFPEESDSARARVGIPVDRTIWGIGGTAGWELPFEDADGTSD